jgi:hypothetical protein
MIIPAGVICLLILYPLSALGCRCFLNALCPQKESLRAD